MTTRRYTSVLAVFERDRLNVRLRFGKPVCERQIDRRRRLAMFTPGSTFALLRWEANAYGTTLSHLAIMRAVAPGETCCMWPYVRPGAKILLFVAGWSQVERALKAVDTVEALGVAPTDAAPEYWQQVHNRLWVHETPRTYSQEQHDAWLRRRELLS